MSVTPSPSIWQDALEQTLMRDLPEFLPGQRWFGGKARRIVSARAEDCVWLCEGGEPGALVIVLIEYASGAPDRYAQMIALCADPGSLPTIGRFPAGSEIRHVVEATGSAPHAAALVRHMGAAHDLHGVHGGVLRFGDVRAGSAGALDPATLGENDVRPIGAEQSNTSLRVGARHVFKLFRRLEAGENPEVEIGRFLSHRTSFQAAPALRGSISWIRDGSAPATVGALKDLVVNQGDGWQWTLARLEEVFAQTATGDLLLREIQSLGIVSAELHAALASDHELPGFAPEAVHSDDVREWETAFRNRGERVLALLDGGLPAMSGATHDACAALLRVRSRLTSAADLPPTTGGGAFDKIRLHGDYHLGQTLKTPDGFVLIDFEGEPARPLGERRALHCALKDVSGMLRSFEYAIESARARAPDGETWNAPPPPLRAAFLEGYEARTAELGSPFLPADLGARVRWRTFFELDKALYEMEYEIQNRPAWLHIPARGMLRLLGEPS